MDNEKYLKSLSRVRLNPGGAGFVPREKRGAVNKKEEPDFQLNSLGGPLEEDFKVQ